MIRRAIRRRDWLLALLLTAALPAVCLAQAAAPPAPELNRNEPVWVGYAFMFLLTAAVIAISLMPSKRSHQD